MYKDESIPSNYNKIAEINNNYIVWVKESKLTSGSNYSAYYQFLQPSTGVLEVDNYRIRNGDTYSLDANYVNNGVYSYIDSYDVNYTLTTSEVDPDSFSTSDYHRADFLGIFGVQVLVCVIFLWVFSQLSRLFFKNGLR